MNIHQISNLGLLQYASQRDERYVPLEYLESSGTQWIDTGVDNIGATWEIKFQFLTTEVDQLMGALARSNARFNFGIERGDSRYFRFGFSSWKNSNTPVDTDIHVFRLSSTDASFSVDFGDKSYGSIGVTAAGNILIFRRPDNNYYVKSGRCYYSKIWDGTGNLVSDMVPMLRLRDSKPGMYDMVGKKFYVNKGTGEFTAGPQITAQNYVQDGLVAMWDGLENSAYGTHANDAIVWKDLVGGIGDATLYAGSRRWKDNGLYVVGGTDRWGIPIGTWFKNRSLFTIEVTISPKKWYITNGTNRILSSTQYGGIYVQHNASTNREGAGRHSSSGYIGVGYDLLQDITRTVIFTSTNNSVSAGFNGSILSTSNATAMSAAGSQVLAISWEPDGNGGGESFASYGAMTGTFHVLRLYNRALTAEELAANYEIDRVRYLL